MKEPIDWIRTVFTGAIMGGFLWGFVPRVLFALSHGHLATKAGYMYFAIVSDFVLTAGAITFFCSSRSFWRSTALGMVLAPLTGLPFISILAVVYFLFRWVPVQ